MYDFYSLTNTFIYWELPISTESNLAWRPRHNEPYGGVGVYSLYDRLTAAHF